MNNGNTESKSNSGGGPGSRSSGMSKSDPSKVQAAGAKNPESVSHQTGYDTRDAQVQEEAAKKKTP